MDFLPCFSAETWTLLILFFCLFIAYGYSPYEVFDKIRIPGPKPSPFFGTLRLYAMGVTHMDMDCHRRYGKVWGMYEGRLPVLCTVDTGMIKTILVKEFYSCFINRRNFRFNGPLSDNLANVHDEHWRRMRPSLSPLFTSGRFKDMFPVLKRNADNLVLSLQRNTNGDEGVDIREFFNAYSMDVIAGAALSLDLDSYNNPTDPIVMNIKKTNFNFTNPALALSVIFPFLDPLLEMANLCIFPLRELSFLFAVVKKLTVDRKKNVHESRADFLQQMMDSLLTETKIDTNESKKPKGLTHHEILSQVVMFWIAGNETSSKSLAFLSYNLATNPDVMKRLQDEIDQVFPNKAPVTFEELMQLEYLDMVLNESLRLHPIAIRLERLCTKTVVVNGVTIPKGTLVQIPVYALHHNPELWPEPELFNPERFRKENKDSLDPYAYLPFGAGPRNCVGKRFAVLLMKLAVVRMLQNFSLATCSETEVPLQLDQSPMLAPKSPIKVKLVPRCPVKKEE